ncbi:MAG: 50S ribosomal protein L21e [Thermoplasmata archaeon]
MSKMSHGPRSKSRQKLRKNRKDGNMVPLTRYFQNFKVDDRVAVDIDSSLHKGMPFHRFHGKIGKVIGTQGNAYLVEVSDGNKKKVIIANSEHLRRHEVPK